MNKKNSEIRTIQDVLQPAREARLSRMSFIKLSVGSIAAMGLGLSATGCKLATERGRALKLKNLREVLQELDLIQSNPPVKMQQEMTLVKMLNHIAQSCEYSMSGYPKMDPAIKQAAAKIVFQNFKKLGFMNHDLAAPVPGAPDIPTTGDLNAAFERLRTAINTYQNYTGTLYPHFSYGELNYADWELAHTFHMADHFSMLTYDIAPA